MTRGNNSLVHQIALAGLYRTFRSAGRWALTMVAASFTFVSSAALANSQPSTRLVRCDTGNCLLVSGRRDSAGSEVRISGKAVVVQGRRNWRTRLPMQTVRQWVAPRERTIEVTVQDARTHEVSRQRANLPIGLMGHVELASLVVSLN